MLFWFDCLFFLFKQKTAYEMRISDWSSDVCSSDLLKVTWPPELSIFGSAWKRPSSRPPATGMASGDPFAGSVAKIVKFENAGRRLDGRNDDGFQVASFPGGGDPEGGGMVLWRYEQAAHIWRKDGGKRPWVC